MKVCLIQPPTTVNVKAVTRYGTPPLGLAYLASSARKAGHDVQGLDAIGEAIHQYSKIPGSNFSLLFGLKFSEICARIKHDTQVIGVSIMFA